VRAVDTLAVASSIPMRPTTPGHHRLSTSIQDVGSSLQSQSLNFNPDLREPSSLQSSTNTVRASYKQRLCSAQVRYHSTRINLCWKICNRQLYYPSWLKMNLEANKTKYIVINLMHRRLHDCWRKATFL